MTTPLFSCCEQANDLQTDGGRPPGVFWRVQCVQNTDAGRPWRTVTDVQNIGN